MNPIAEDDNFTTSNQVQLNENAITRDDGDGLVDRDEEPGVLTILAAGESAGTVSSGNVDGTNSASVSFTTSVGATVRVNADGTFEYDPTTSATLLALTNGNTQDDTFSYQIQDPDSGTSNIATVTVTVVGANKPNANSDAYSANEDTVLNVDAASGVLANEDDAIEQPNLAPADLPVRVDIGSSDTVSAAGATITWNVVGNRAGVGDLGDGAFDYDGTGSIAIQSLAAGETFTDTFDYTVITQNNVPETTTVTVTVTGEGAIEIRTTDAVNDGTTPGGDAADDTISVSDDGTTLTIAVNGTTVRSVALADLPAGPTDIQIAGSSDGDTLDIGPLSSPKIGTVSVDASVETTNINGAISVGALTIDSADTNLGASVTTSGDQTYNGAVLMNGDATLTSVNTTFNSTVDSDPGERNLVLVSSGVVAIQDNVGATGALGSFDTSGSADIQVATSGFDTLQGSLLWNFDFSSVSAGATSVADAAGSTNAGGNGFTVTADTTQGAGLDPTIIAVTDANLARLSAAGDIVGGVTAASSSGAFHLQTGGADTAPSAIDPNPDGTGPNPGAVSFEFWINPDSIISPRVNGASVPNSQSIWETGGGTGTGFAIDGAGNLVFRNTTGPTELTFDLNTLPDTGSGAGNDQWIHVVGTMDVDAPDSTDEMILYVNGNQVAQTDGPDIGDWDGGDPSSLGGIGGANMGGWGGGTAPGGQQFETFDGQIAVFRMYNEVLDLSQVQNNRDFMNTTGQEAPASITIATTGAQNHGNMDTGAALNVTSGATVTFSGTLDDDGNGATSSAITITSTGNTVFNDAVGGTDVVDAVTVTAPTIHVHGGSVTTIGDQDYNGNVHTIATPVSYTTSAGDIDVSGDFTALSDATVNAIGDFAVGGNADIDGVSSITTTGATSISGTTDAEGAFTVSASSSASFGGAADFAAGVSITSSGAVNLNDTLTVTGGDYTVNSGGNTTVAGVTDVTGNMDVTASGNANFNSMVDITGNITVSSTNATFANTITGQSTSDVTLNVSAVTSLAAIAAGSLTTDFAGRTELNGTVTLSGATDSAINDQVLLRADTTVDVTSAANLTFGATIDSASGSNFGLTVNGTGGGDLNFLKQIGADALAGVSSDTGLGSFITTGAGTVTLGSNAVNLAHINPEHNFNASFDDPSDNIWEKSVQCFHD